MATSAFFKFDFRHVIPTSGRVKIDFIPSSVISSYGAPFFFIYHGFKGTEILDLLYYSQTEDSGND